MYKVEITFHQGTEREFTYEADCDTLQAAVEQIENWAAGMFMCRAWINNKEVRVLNCHVVGSDGEPLCTNPAWHETFAKPSDRILPFRPQPTRGSAPQNPATLAARGEI